MCHCWVKLGYVFSLNIRPFVEGLWTLKAPFLERLLLFLQLGEKMDGVHKAKYVQRAKKSWIYVTFFTKGDFKKMWRLMTASTADRVFE